MPLELLTSPKLYCDKDFSDAELHLFAEGEVGVFNKKCPGKDSPNEDSAAIIPFDKNSGILVVADGAGGMPSGARASEATVNALQKSLKEATKKNLPLRTAILDGIENANKEIVSWGIGSATTVAVVEFTKNTIRTYHVGDSQIMVLGQKGKLKTLTLPHSPVGYAVESGIMGDQEALHHEERHLVSNLLGDASMRIEVGSQMELAAKDTVVLASDGLFDNMKIDEIIEHCRKGSLLSICESIASICKTRMEVPAEGRPSKPDDLAFLVYRLRE